MQSEKQFSITDSGLVVRAPAKINLSLLIAGKRPDGYHEIQTVMAKINWYDLLVFEKSAANTLELHCTGPYWAPDGEENLVHRACNILLKHNKSSFGLKITLIKNIPAGTGLGSASSDAAAALLGLNRLAGFNLTAEQLIPLAASLGSDVAFFLTGPLALCTGKGEKIRQIYKKFTFRAMVVTPNLSVSTKKVYENYTHNPQMYDILSGQINGLMEKNRIDSTAGICANMLAISCFRLYPELEALKERFENLSGRRVCLSGSGSAMYCLFEDGQEGRLEICRARLKEEFGCESRFVYNNSW